MASIYLVVLLMALASTLCEDMARDNIDYHLLKHSNQFETVNGSRYRLPTSVVPLKYNLKLIPYIIEGNFTFDGQVDITVEAVESVQKITFHVYQLKLDSKLITVKELLEPHKQVVVKDVEEDEELDFYTLNLESALKEKTRYVISIQKYTGILNGNMTGFYRSRYFTPEGRRRWLATTQFEATHAREAFPCFDEPALKARFTISISRPEGLRAISNMPQAGQPQLDTVNTDEVRYWDHFEETPLMSTYLVAFVVSDFEYLDEEMRIFAARQFLNYTRHALSHSKGILDWLADYVGVSYDMPKMDQVAIPIFRDGAMENWGLVTWNANELLINDELSQVQTKQRTTMIIGHEFAHQWFGDLVSPLWWKYVWLNEGFATYLGYLAIDKRLPEWRFDDQFVEEILKTAMHIDASPKKHAMVEDVSTPDEIRAIFDDISFAKAASVIRMMESVVTTATFRKGLQHYLQSRAYSTATPEDLFESLSNQMKEDKIAYDGIDFKDAMQPWTLQAGFPLLTVTRDYNEDQGANLMQQQVFEFPEDESVITDHKWYIPLTYTNQAEPDFETTRPKHWLHPKDTATTSRITNLGNNSQWVLFNVKLIGYYRVNYDERNWELLTAYLKSPEFEKIPPANRAQILSDAFNLGKAGIIPYSVPLTLSTYLRQERDFIPWRTADDCFDSINMYAEDTRDHQVFLKFLRHLRKESGETLGLRKGPDDDHVTKLRRAAAAKRACYFGEKDCVERAVEEVASWMEQPANNKIDPDLREVFYCAAVRHGNSTVFDFFTEQQRLISILPSERDLIIKARGCSEDQEMLRSFLDEVLVNDSNITKQESKAVFEAVYSHPIGLKVAFHYVTENFEKVIKTFGSQKQVFSMIHKMATRSNHVENANQLKSFLRLFSNRDGTYEAVISEAIKIIVKKNRWFSTSGKKVIQWIDEYFESPDLEST